MEWLTAETIEKAGAIVVALFALTTLGVVFKGYREQGKEFNIAITNHLHDLHLDKIADTESREKNTTVLQKLVDRMEK